MECDHSGFGFICSFCFQFSTFSPNSVWFPHIWSLSILNVIKLPFPVEMEMGYILGYTWKTERLEKAWGVASGCSVQMCNLGDWSRQIPSLSRALRGKLLFSLPSPLLAQRFPFPRLFWLIYPCSVSYLQSISFISTSTLGFSSILFMSVGHYFFSYFSVVPRKFWEKKEINVGEILSNPLSLYPNKIMPQIKWRMLILKHTLYFHKD